MYFVIHSVYHMSKEELSKAWLEIQKSPYFIKSETEPFDPNKPDLEIIKESINRADRSWCMSNFIPQPDAAFEKTCKEYTQDWENHKPNIINTAINYTTTPTEKPLDKK